MHLQKAADALSNLLRRVVNIGTAGQASRINPEKRELTDKGIGHDFEDQRREWLFVIRRTDLNTAPIGRPTLDRRNIDRRRQVSNDGIQ